MLTEFIRSRDETKKAGLHARPFLLVEAKIVRNEKTKTSKDNSFLVWHVLQVMCRNPDGFLHKHIRFRFFCARFRRTTYACTPCATKSNAPTDFISPQAREAKKAQTEKAKTG